MSEAAQPIGAKRARDPLPDAVFRQPTPEKPGDSEARLRDILRTAVEGIVTIDEEGLIESMNPAAEAIFGWTEQELRGRKVNLLMPTPWSDEHDTYLRNYRQGGRAKIIGIGREVRGRRKDGWEFPMDLSVSEVRLSSGRLFTGFVRDISQRKESEAKLEAMASRLVEQNKELETILYVASHDLRSPMVNIQGFAGELRLSCERMRELLRGLGVAEDPQLQAVLHGEIPEALEFIQAAVSKMGAILSGLLYFARVGRAKLTFCTLDMNAALREVTKAMEFQIQRARARVEVDALPPCFADETQTSQVFSNLLDNAIKYLEPSRPGVITVTGEVQEGTAVYVVRDNGIGIAREQMGKVFEIFQRLNPGVGEGEGIGLAIAQRLVERQGGKIWLESEVGKGTAFHVALPAVQSSQPGRV